MTAFEKALDTLYLQAQVLFSFARPALVFFWLSFAGLGVLCVAVWWRRRRRAESVDLAPETAASVSDDLDHLTPWVALSGVTQALTAVHDVARLHRTILQQVRALFPSVRELGIFAVENPQNAQMEKTLVLVAHHGIPPEAKHRIPWDRGLVGRASEQELLLWSDEFEDRFGRQAAREDTEHGWYSPSVAVPICLQAQFFACLTLTGSFDPKLRGLHERLLLILRDLAALAYSNAHKIESLDQSNRRLAEQAQALSDFNQNLRLKVEDQVGTLRAQEHQLVQTEQLALFGEFVATFAHDIKNPLAFIAGEAQWAQELLGDSQTVDRDGLKKSIDVIRKNSARLEEDIQTLVGKLKMPVLESATISLNGVIEDLLLLVRRHAESKGIEILWKPSGADVQIQAYPGLLRHALMNLISNSLAILKAKQRLSLVLAADAERVHLTVEDTGPGIDPEDVPKLFQLFYSGREGGTGLGLYSVRRVIEKQHQGKIRVVSQVGKGTTFHIELPRRFDTAE